MFLLKINIVISIVLLLTTYIDITIYYIVIVSCLSITASCWPLRWSLPSTRKLRDRLHLCGHFQEAAAPVSFEELPGHELLGLCRLFMRVPCRTNHTKSFCLSPVYSSLASRTLTLDLETNTRKNGVLHQFWYFCPMFLRHLGVSENVVYPIVPNGFADHYPYWMAINWEYTQFSDKPIWL